MAERESTAPERAYRSGPDVADVGIIGLGNMGRALAANIVAAGFPLIAFDHAGTAGRAPDGVIVANSVDEIASATATVLLSLPDGHACAEVLHQLLAAPRRVVHHVVDTSTVGVAAAQTMAAIASDHQVTYVDAPVSGGVAGAVNRTITVMFAGPDESFIELRPLLDAISRTVIRVGATAGMGQALKLANNFLSACAMAATSEALAFGVRMGLDPATVLEVINQSSGRSTASAERFPRHVLTGSYDAGFRNTLMDKDLGLYLAAARAAGTARPVGEPLVAVWHQFTIAEPDVDYTRIHAFIEALGALDDASS
jgi:3-hydroxyisobutyrate dehydrogenase-like beta-hydroxyacid dehydrogenase